MALAGGLRYTGLKSPFSRGVSMYFRRNSAQLTQWHKALIAREGNLRAGVDRSVADRTLYNFLPLYAFSEKVGDGHPAVYLSGVLNFLSGRYPPAGQLLDRLLDATNNLRTVPNSRRALSAFADRVPLGTPKQYYHATLALAAMLTNEELPVFTAEGNMKGKPIIKYTSGAMEMLNGTFLTEKKGRKKLTPEGMNAILLMANAIIDSADPNIPYIFPQDTDDDDEGIEVDRQKKKSRRQDLLDSLGRGSGAGSSSAVPSPSLSRAAETRPASAQSTRRNVTAANACTSEDREAQLIRMDQNDVPEVIEVELDANSRPKQETAHYLVGSAQEKIEAIEAGRRAGDRVYLFPCRSRDPEGTVMKILLEMATAPDAAESFEDLF